MRVATCRPSQAMGLVPGSSVTSARNGSPSTVPSCRDWSTAATGNSGLVIAVGRENTGTARSTRRPSGARRRHPVSCSFLTHAGEAGIPRVEAGTCALPPAPPPSPQAPAASTRASPIPPRPATRR
jgi:hypothetical protein